MITGNAEISAFCSFTALQKALKFLCGRRWASRTLGGEVRSKVSLGITHQRLIHAQQSFGILEMSCTMIGRWKTSSSSSSYRWFSWDAERFPPSMSYPQFWCDFQFIVSYANEWNFEMSWGMYRVEKMSVKQIYYFYFYVTLTLRFVQELSEKEDIRQIWECLMCEKFSKQKSPWKRKICFTDFFYHLTWFEKFRYIWGPLTI